VVSYVTFKGYVDLNSSRCTVSEAGLRINRFWLLLFLQLGFVFGGLVVDGTALRRVSVVLGYANQLPGRWKLRSEKSEDRG
jgi:hypothetical protein